MDRHMHLGPNQPAKTDLPDVRRPLAASPIQSRTRPRWRTLAWVASGIFSSGILSSSALADDGSFALDSNDFRIGHTTVVSATGVGDSQIFLMFDAVPGDYTLPGGAWFGLGLSSAFTILEHSIFPSSGHKTWTFGVPDDSNLVGMPVYLQLAAQPPSHKYFTTSNRIDEQIQNGDTDISGFIPDESHAIHSETPIEILINGHVDDATVLESSVRLYNETDGRDIDVDLSLFEGATESVVIIEPEVALAAGTVVSLDILDGLHDDRGNSLGGQRQASWTVHQRQHPVLLNTTNEIQLFHRRIQNDREPWKSSWDETLYETDREAMKHQPDPHHGPPPTSWSSYVDVYNRWSSSARYAQDLAMAWLITGNVKYAGKAEQIILDWMVYQPEQVGSWYWVIMTDIAGMSFLDAIDLLWGSDGLDTQERKQIRDFLDQLGDALVDWQMMQKDKNPGNIRSWTNTLMTGIGYFNQCPDLVEFAVRRSGNSPFSWEDLFDRALAADGEIWDGDDRKDEEPYYEVTYPIYHLQAWGIMSEMALHHGVNLFDDVNAKGATQQDGWEYYVPHIRGDIWIEGLTSTIKRYYCISKYYFALKHYRSDKIRGLFDLSYGAEPLVEPHVRKNLATLAHRIPDALVGVDDDDPPQPPKNPVVHVIGTHTAYFSWKEGQVNDEGDLASHYLIYRNDQLIGLSPDPHYIDHGLAPGSSYQYRIHSLDYVGNLSGGLNVDVDSLPLN